MKAWDKLILMIAVLAGLFGAGIEVYLQMFYKSKIFEGETRSEAAVTIPSAAVETLFK